MFRLAFLLRGAALLAAATSPLALAGQPATATAPGGAGYQLVRRIAVPGEGGWDYLMVDPVARRLYLSHSTRVEVIDVDAGTIIGSIPNTLGVHGIAIAPELGRGFTSNGRDSSVTIFDAKTLAVIGVVKVTGRNPDAIAYDPATKRVFTFNGGSANATAIDAQSGTVVGTIALGGRPEFAQVDGLGHLWVNLEDRSAVVQLDTRALTAGAPWPLTPCEEPSGMAMDRAHRRLFIGCSNKLMAVMDADKGTVITTLPIGSGVDANAFDPALQLAFASNGDGTLTVVREDAPDRFTVVGTAATAPRARTMAVDERSHHVYLPFAQFNPPPPAMLEVPRPRPTMVPGSFALLELAPTGVESSSAPAAGYKRDVPSRLAVQARIPEDSARAIAQARIPRGEVRALELENEGGKLIYSFELKIAGKEGIEEVNVDALNGKIVSIEHEGATKEKKKAPPR
ncbi:MAG: PepSY domain-containing protein [Gemmatimonadota bacterium]|nr:PepSY domain-containing protein [Gemmatimonadota bacterium]